MPARSGIDILVKGHAIQLLGIKRQFFAQKKLHLAKWELVFEG
jgi:hypothetical protein